MPNILLVDDDSVSLKVCEAFLKKRGFSVKTAADGLDAITKADDSIDLVVTDLFMDGISGVDLCSIVEKKLNKKLPYILVTGGELPPDDQARLFDCILLKPFTSTALHDAVSAAMFNAA